MLQEADGAGSGSRRTTVPPRDLCKPSRSASPLLMIQFWPTSRSTPIRSEKAFRLSTVSLRSPSLVNVARTAESLQLPDSAALVTSLVCCQLGQAKPADVAASLRATTVPPASCDAGRRQSQRENGRQTERIRYSNSGSGNQQARFQQPSRPLGVTPRRAARRSLQSGPCGLAQRYVSSWPARTVPNRPPRSS